MKSPVLVMTLPSDDSRALLSLLTEVLSTLCTLPGGMKRGIGFRGVQSRFSHGRHKSSVHTQRNVRGPSGLFRLPVPCVSPLACSCLHHGGSVLRPWQVAGDLQAHGLCASALPHITLLGTGRLLKEESGLYCVEGGPPLSVHRLCTLPPAQHLVRLC